ncbi:hypothetical protein NQ315_008588 [Exocentrus adspersus]|uniref:Uncharacterized protein n=1 Tax=Exocentrus adspersus TaxID=1586481 RepID=A0AAV8W657_9CUCU|nr:hypothetical protein NQ315_008588 [Exocentrus adspersus]
MQIIHSVRENELGNIKYSRTFTSSGVNSKSNISIFFSTLSLLLDLGIGIVPIWTRNRKITCALVFPYFSPMLTIWGLSKETTPSPGFAHGLAGEPRGLQVYSFNFGYGLSDWPVHQVQVDVVQAEVTQRFLASRNYLVPGMEEVPKFGHDEEFFACHSFVFDFFFYGSADFFFVSVDPGAVYVAVSDTDGVFHGIFPVQIQVEMHSFPIFGYHFQYRLSLSQSSFQNPHGTSLRTIHFVIHIDASYVVHVISPPGVLE